MIVSDIMTVNLVTIAAEDTLSHADNLFRQYQFHHLPVVRSLNTQETMKAEHSNGTRKTLFLLEGMVTTQDIDVAIAMGKHYASGDVLHRPWHEIRVAEVMHRATMRVTPTTSVAAAAQMLVERNVNCLPVVEYEYLAEHNPHTMLVGLLTRSDLLMALARSLGAFEPGMQLVIPLPMGDLTPLAQTLLLAAEQHVQVRSIMASPLQGNVPGEATIRLGTINPAPLLLRLQQSHIEYTFADPLDPLVEGDAHV